MPELKPLSKPFGESAPKIAPPSASVEPSYVDGSVSSYDGANPGRDQDRSRVDERCPASYSYPGGAFGSSQDNSDVDSAG